MAIKKFDITDSGSNAIDYINEELKKAWLLLYHIQEHAESLRKTYIEELATYKAKNGIASGAEIKKLIYIEEVRKTARKHGWYLKERRKGMVDHVLIPTYNTAVVPAFMY